jgi:hypothetical protein
MRFIGLFLLSFFFSANATAQEFSQVEFQQNRINAKEKFGSLQLNEKILGGTVIQLGEAERGGMPQDMSSENYTVQFNRNGNKVSLSCALH